MDLCTESSDLSESVTLEHLKEDLNLVTDEDLTDLLKRECNEPEDTANVRCAQLIIVLSNHISKIFLLILKAMNKQKLLLINEMSIRTFGNFKGAQRGHPNEEAVDLEEVQGLQVVQGLPPLNINKKTLEEVLSSKFLQA